MSEHHRAIAGELGGDIAADRNATGKSKRSCGGIQGEATYSIPGATARSSDGDPLRAVLDWLFHSAAQREGGPQGVVTGGVSGSGSGVAAGGSNAASASAALDGSSGRWRAAIVASLIRALSRLDPFRARGGGSEAGDQQEDGRVREWLTSPVASFARSPKAEATSPGCPGFDMAQDIEHIVLKGWGGDGGQGGGGNTDVPGEMKSEDETRRSGPPLWLVLVAGVLGGRGDCYSPDASDVDTRGDTSPLGRRRSRKGEEEEGRLRSKMAARPATHGRGSPAHGGSGFNGSGSCCDAFLPQAVLSEVLALAPDGGPARVLSSLSRVVAATPLETCHAFPHLCEGRVEEDSVDDEMRHLRVRRQNSALCALGRVWRAEAARFVSAWKPFHIAAAAAADGVQRTFGDLGRPLGAPETQPDDGLLACTADSLRILLKTATLFSRAAPPTSEPAVSVAGSDNRVGQGMEGCCHTKKTIFEGEAGASAAGSEEDNAGTNAGPRTGCDRRQPCRRTAAAVNEAFGTEAAGIWRALFARRQEFPKGFSGLLKKLAKDCALLALSARTEDANVVAGSALKGKGGEVASQAPCEVDRRKSAGWGVDFSQTQRDQCDRGTGEKEVTCREQNGVAGTKDFAHDVEQSALEGQGLAPAPPFASLPVLTAAAHALLRAGIKEVNKTARMRAWVAGVATLAWVLTSPKPTAPPIPCPAPPTATARATGTEGRGRSAAVCAMGTVAARGGVFAELCECLSAVRGAVASGVRGHRGAEILLGQDLLVPVFRLLAVGISHSCAAPSVSSGKPPCASSCPRVASVASTPAVREEVRGLALCVLSVLRGFPPDVVASPGLLSASTPMLEAVLDMPKSRYVSKTWLVTLSVSFSWQHAPDFASSV